MLWAQIHELQIHVSIRYSYSYGYSCPFVWHVRTKKLSLCPNLKSVLTCVISQQTSLSVFVQAATTYNYNNNNKDYNNYNHYSNNCNYNCRAANEAALIKLINSVVSEVAFLCFYALRVASDEAWREVAREEQIREIRLESSLTIEQTFVWGM